MPKWWEERLQQPLKTRLTKQKQVIVDWIEKADVLEHGQSVNIPCQSKNQQKQFLKEIREELRLRAEFNPESAASISAADIFHSGHLWVCLTKVAVSPKIGLVATGTGDDKKFERAVVDIPSSQDRIKKLMRQDQKEGT